MNLDADDLENERWQLDAEWLALNALREVFGIAYRGVTESTYLGALAVGRRVAPTLFDPASSILSAGQEPPLAREYRQRADAKSAELGRRVSPVELIDSEIAEDERLTEIGGGPRDQIRRAIARRQRAREWFEERVYSEHKILSRDVFSVNRPDLPLPKMYGDYVEYRLPFERALRIRLLHPDRPEHSTGADLVYEFCDQEARKARVAFLQYKIWDGKALRFSDAANLPAQISRLEAICCKGGLCESATAEGPPGAYRFPYCAAFLRPTDRLQRSTASLISSGIHVPICIAKAVDLERVGGRVLRRDPLRERSISQRIFEELFNRNMSGSRWLAYEEIERLYSQHRVLESNQRIIVYAQEYDWDDERAVG